MALFPCPECGRQISTRAAACPQCGCPVEAPIPLAPDPPAAPVAPVVSAEPYVLTDTDGYLKLRAEHMPLLGEIIRRRGDTVTDIRIAEDAEGMITPSFLAQLRHFTALEKLDLRGVSSVTDAALHHIAACRTLVEINLKRTGITGSGLHELLALDDLQEVDLKECPRLHPRHVPVLAGLPSVRRVGIPIDDDNRLFTYEVRKELKSHFPSECSVR